jgi:nitrite reductase/ring-hydroxylating ferredoxin subunit
VGELIKVAKVAEIPEGTGKTVEAGGKKIAVFNVGGKFYAIDDTCKHRGGPLGEGELDGTNVTCPWHGWEYDVTTGKNLDDENIRLGCYAAKADGDDIVVEL